MKKRVFIIHGWGGQPDEHWLPWLKQQLEERGFAVAVPAMPNTDEPVIEEWVEHLRGVVGTAGEQTYFVGHSIGCQTIMRYLATINEQVGGCVFVAGWFKLAGELYEEGDEVVQLSKPWVETPIDFEHVRGRTCNFTVFLSDDDPYNAVEENTQLFTEKLGADVQVMHEKGHFTTDVGVTELPEVVGALLKYSETQ